MSYINYDTRIHIARGDSGGGVRQVCRECDRPLHTHDRKRVYPDDGPTGAYHYRYICDSGRIPALADD